MSGLRLACFLPLAAALAVACVGPPGGQRVPGARLAPLEARVEATRERAFRARVRATAVPPESVSELLGAEFDHVVPLADAEAEEALARALGLLPADVDLRTSSLAFQATSIAGFYSQTERRLYVVDEPEQTDAEAVLVHELVHALQDQHSDLLELMLGLRGDDDLGFALSALLEGEATWVELEDAARRAGAARLSAQAFAQQVEASLPESAEEAPLLMRESVVRAYPLGYALADALVRRGGPGALDAAQLAPPLSSEELLHPEQYLGEAPRKPLALLPLDPAAPGCHVAATNSYGELGVRIWLREAGLDLESAAEAATGWDGDRAWSLACGGETRSAWLIGRDDEAAALALERAVRGRLEWRGDLALRVDRAGTRVLVSGGIAADERARLLELPEQARVASLADYLAARPEAGVRGRALRR